MDGILRNEIENIRKYVLVKLPNEAVTPKEFLELNEMHIKETMEEIKKKSIYLENIFHYMIKLILFRINDKYSFKDNDKMYDFFNVTTALENVRDSDVSIKGEIILN